MSIINRKNEDDFMEMVTGVFLDMLDGAYIREAEKEIQRHPFFKKYVAKQLSKDEQTEFYMDLADKVGQFHDEYGRRMNGFGPFENFMSDYALDSELEPGDFDRAYEDAFQRLEKSDNREYE